MMSHGCCGSSHRMCKGIMMLVFGVLFFLGTLNVWPEFTFVKYWPLVIIVAGVHNLACKSCAKGDDACCEAPHKK